MVEVGPVGPVRHPCCGTDSEHRADCWTRDPHKLPWYRPWRTWRCRARTERNDLFHGRCELVAGHPRYVDHALERGFATPRWVTRWTG